MEGSAQQRLGAWGSLTESDLGVSEAMKGLTGAKFGGRWVGRWEGEPGPGPAGHEWLC